MPADLPVHPPSLRPDGPAVDAPAGPPAALRCAGLTVGPISRPRLAEVDLEIRPGELVGLLGPSGAGKSTLLAAVAGLLQPAAGEIWLAGRRVADAHRGEPPERRGVAMVFQHYALWPHLGALDTVAYPLRRAGMGRDAARRRARDLLDQLGVGDLAARRPAELSGGEQQRVGLARALARRADLYLLDEPTAHLDVPLRASFQAAVRDRQRALGVAALYATHDPAEALRLADRLVLLVGGRVAQAGAPAEVYRRPVDAAAARLTGEVSALSGRRESAAGPVLLDLGEGPQPLPAAEPAVGPVGAVTVLIRPEWTGPGEQFRAAVAETWLRGEDRDCRVATPAGELVVRCPAAGAGPAPGTELGWQVRRSWVVAGQPSVASAPR